MNLADCGTQLATLVDRTVIASPEKTPLSTAARTILIMARAYTKDGNTFLTTGDLVNALAGYYYGFGWLHFGWAYGLLVKPETALDCCPFKGTCERLPAIYAPKLAEKTSRYARLLETARTSVLPAADPATSMHDFSCRILAIAGCYAMQGTIYQKAGASEDALACYSYGHGWLDAAVRSGLFCIAGERQLFTV